LIAAIEDYLDGPVYTGILPRSGPTITAPPIDQAVVVGSNAMFSVVAVGPPPLTYQWSFNGTNIVGATNSVLVLTNVQFNQAGLYGVQVSDIYGSRYGPNAMLTVRATNSPVFTSIAVLPNGGVQGTISGNTGPTVIEASTNLANWVVVTNIMLTNTVLQFTDPAATNYPHRFYRARLQ
jgi:hypothetical protein